MLVGPWYVALKKGKRLQDYKRSFKYSQRVLPAQQEKLNCTKKGNFLYSVNTFSLQISYRPFSIQSTHGRSSPFSRSSVIPLCHNLGLEISLVSEETVSLLTSCKSLVTKCFEWLLRLVNFSYTTDTLSTLNYPSFHFCTVFCRLNFSMLA